MGEANWEEINDMVKGGAHIRWDTTTLANGKHRLELRIFEGSSRGVHRIPVTVGN